MKILAWLKSRLLRKWLAGTDQFGNCYYEGVGMVRSFNRPNRSIVYCGIAEPSKIPAAWYSWLHYQLDTTPKNNDKKYKWEKERIPNLTGTAKAYYPAGHLLGKGKRDKAIGDYQAWRPK